MQDTERNYTFTHDGCAKERYQRDFPAPQANPPRCYRRSACSWVKLSVGATWVDQPTKGTSMVFTLEETMKGRSWSKIHQSPPRSSGVWEVFICLLDELKGEAFTFLAWRAGVPPCFSGQENTRADLFPSYLNGWTSQETIWNYETLWETTRGSGPHSTLATFVWDLRCATACGHQEGLLVWMVNEDQFPVKPPSPALATPTSLSLSLSPSAMFNFRHTSSKPCTCSCRIQTKILVPINASSTCSRWTKTTSSNGGPWPRHRGIGLLAFTLSRSKARA